MKMNKELINRRIGFKTNSTDTIILIQFCADEELKSHSKLYDV